MKNNFYMDLIIFGNESVMSSMITNNDNTSHRDNDNDGFQQVRRNRSRRNSQSSGSSTGGARQRNHSGGSRHCGARQQRQQHPKLMMCTTHLAFTCGVCATRCSRGARRCGFAHHLEQQDLAPAIKFMKEKIDDAMNPEADSDLISLIMGYLAEALLSWRGGAIG